MAEVFKAKSYGVEGFEKIIAIKRILPAMGEDKDFIKMFIDEAKIAGQLSHASICQIFELGKIKGSHFIAMEFIWGKDLLQIQNRMRKLDQVMPVPMACYIVSKVCEGLDYAHRKKDALGRPLEIIHRDCSPQNVLVSYEGEVKIIDFGIARAASRSSRTNAGVLKGKFGYMSPEQVRGLPLDNRSDLFAVGTVFYESLTGERLFQGESDFSTLERVRNADVRPPSQLNQNIPAEVERIVMRALARDPKQRYESGGEMHAELQAFLTRQDTPFTGKTLADWLKGAFQQDLVRERDQMEEYKRVGRDGLIAGVPQAHAQLDVVSELGLAGAPEGDPTVLGGPDFEELDRLVGIAGAAGEGEEHSRQEPRGKVVRAGGERPSPDDWGDEGPTEIFGEIGEGGMPLSPANRSQPVEPVAVQPMAVQADAAGAGAGPGPAASNRRTILGDSSSMVGGPPPMPGGGHVPGHGLPGGPGPQNGSGPGGPGPQNGSGPGGPGPQNGSGPGGPGPGGPPTGSLPAFYPVLQPGRPAYPAEAGGYNPYPPPVDRPFAPPAPGGWRARRRNRRGGVWRDVAIGCAIAALVLAAFISTKYLLFGGEPPAEAQGKDSGTIAVVVRDPRPAQVAIDGKAMGTTKGEAPLTLSPIAPGDHTVLVTRAGAPPCTKKVSLAAQKIEVVECIFPKAVSTGRVVLEDVGESDRVFLDDQEISLEAAREPLHVEPGVEHTISVKVGDEVVDQFSVEVGPDQQIEHRIRAHAGKSKSHEAAGGGKDQAEGDKHAGLPDSHPHHHDQHDTAATSSGASGAGSSSSSSAGSSSGGSTRSSSGGSTRSSSSDGTDSSSHSAQHTAAAQAGPGSFTAFTKPWARVYIDGKDTGKMTPIAPRSAISLQPGRHKVVFEVGDQRFPYSITIEPGKRKNLVKVLPVK